MSPTSSLQYVKVASNQKDVMQLGGNLPDSLNQHLRLEYKPETDRKDDKDSTEPNAKPLNVENEAANDHNNEDEEVEKEKLKVG